MTTAECVDNVRTVEVIVGEKQQVQVKKVTQHFLYSNKKNNLAILELVKPLELSAVVKPIAYNNSYDLDNEEVTALGIKSLNGVSIAKATKKLANDFTKTIHSFFSKSSPDTLKYTHLQTQLADTFTLLEPPPDYHTSMMPQLYALINF